MQHDAGHPEVIGPYRIVRQIGRGGMGIVYEARDDRLGRPVAIKTVLQAQDAQVRERFLREARSAAAVSHPHICQLFEIGEHDGAPYLAMEMLDGQSLADRLDGSPLAASEAIPIAISILSALAALHARGIVHRDLKPSNVFLTPHGVKLLDFGLARPVATDTETTSLTVPGLVLGTPRYMAPEQARGSEVDARTDIFAAGALLFEMLSGRPAFDGPSAVEVLHAVIHEQPPALVGSPAIVAVDGVIHRALAKSPARRYESAEAMAMDLRACLTRGDISSGAVARATTRLIVLPFRLLRPDPEIEFLAFSLPDAITVSLSGIESLVVRSSLTASRFAGASLDLREIVEEAAVDAVVTGTLLHAAGLVRINVQLIEAPSGTVRWSHAAQVRFDDLFQIQDSISSAVVDALALPLTTRERGRLGRDVPANPDAYAHYLRANRLSVSAATWDEARQHYEQAVAVDPSYAPAWARLGRCLRVIGKYGTGPDGPRYRFEAERAFEHAFELNPDLSIAHNLFTYLEVENGRAPQAMIRLLGRLREPTSEPDLYAGLVHACRYCGLLDASVAAYERAARLDPSIRTSVAHSHFMRGDYDRAIEADVEDPPYVTAVAMLSMGRTRDALALCEAAFARASLNNHLSSVLRAVAATVTGQFEDGIAAVSTLMEFRAFADPEGWYYWALASSGLQDDERALDLLRQAVDSGLSCVRALETPPQFDRLRVRPAFRDLVERARAGQSAAARMFAEADGHRLLGIASP